MIKIKSDYNFTSADDRIKTEDDSGKTTIAQFDVNNGGYILVLVKEILYICDIEGTFLLKDSSIKSSLGARYYSLKPYKIENNEYFYVISCVISSNINLLYYKYNPSKNTNSYINKINNYRGISKENEQKEIYDNGVSCEPMIHSSFGKVLTCFYQIATWPYEFCVTSFDPDSNFNKISSLATKYITFDYNKGMTSYIKSAVNEENKKALVCATILQDSSGSHGGECLSYDIDSNNMGSFTKYGTACKSYAFGFQVNYFRETGNFVFSCFDNNAKLTITTFKSDTTTIETKEDTTTCYSEFSYSLQYSYHYDNYAIISDTKCKSDSDSDTDDVKYLSFYSISNVGATYILPPIEIEEMEEIEENEENEKINEIKEEYEEYNEEEEEEISVEERKTLIEEIEEFQELLEEFEELEEIKPQPFVCPLQKCASCNEESSKQKKCISCNRPENFFPIDYKDNRPVPVYIDCYNEDTKPKNFFFNKDTNFYEPCYETCETCINGGNAFQHNCTTCDTDLTFRPEDKGTTNCVANCAYLYYYTIFGQYKCTDTSRCPDDYKLLIKNK